MSDGPHTRARAVRLLHALGVEAARVSPRGLVVAPRSRVALNGVARGAVVASDRRRGGQDRLALDKALTSFLVHQHVLALLELYRVTCVVDVGANRGQYASALRRAGYAGHIVSFEPVPETFAQLRDAAAGDPRWTAHAYALGREDGETELHVVPGTLSSALPATRFGARRYERLRRPRTETVPVRRLDGLLDEVLPPGDARSRPYLKLDTQGFDLEVFAGLGERARDFVAMQSEVALVRIYEGMPRMPEALAAYEAAGFEVTGLYPVSRERRTARVLEFDCVMARPDALRDGWTGPR